MKFTIDLQEEELERLKEITGGINAEVEVPFTEKEMLQRIVIFTLSDNDSDYLSFSNEDWEHYILDND